MSASDRKTSVTKILAQAGFGEDREVLDRLLPYVYEELRIIARSLRMREPRHASLATTGLVHEAYLKLVKQRDVPVRSRAYFFAAAARAMRQILVDAARCRRRVKRGGGVEPKPLTSDVADRRADDFAGSILEINDALDRLRERHPRAVEVVECRYFGGLSIDQTASALDCSISSVNRDWAFARAWLFRTLRRDLED